MGYQKNASKYIELSVNLPEGWVKNDYKDKNFTAPYIHPSTGRESWQHPNRPKMDALTKELNDEAVETRAQAPSKSNRSLIKKLRMMLQNGIPRGAVEQRAKLEGVDMAYVLGEKKLDGDDSESDDEKNTVMLDGRWEPEQVRMALSDIINEKETTAIAS